MKRPLAFLCVAVVWMLGSSRHLAAQDLVITKEGLTHELRALSLIFSTKDIIKLMGPNTTAFIEKSRDLGTIEPGKLADIVIVDGDPLDLIYNLLNVKVVIKGGTIVVDTRQ